MYKHPRRDRGLTSVMAILAPIALLLMVALVPIHIGSHAAVAATGPLVVDGIVYSSGGNPVANADVQVTVLDGINLRVVMPTTSDVNGFYTVTVDRAFWDAGNTISVSATDGTNIGSNSTVVTDPDAFGVTVDVHLGATGIPELGGPATVALTVAAIGMLVVFFARRRGPSSP